MTRPLLTIKILQRDNEPTRWHIDTVVILSSIKYNYIQQRHTCPVVVLRDQAEEHWLHQGSVSVVKKLRSNAQVIVRVCPLWQPHCPSESIWSELNLPSKVTSSSWSCHPCLYHLTSPIGWSSPDYTLSSYPTSNVCLVQLYSCYWTFKGMWSSVCRNRHGSPYMDMAAHTYTILTHQNSYACFSLTFIDWSICPPSTSSAFIIPDPSLVIC